MEQYDRGVLVVDASHQPRHAQGLARDPSLQQALLALLRSFDRRPLPNLIPVEGLEMPLVAAVSESPDGVLLVVHRTEPGDPLMEFVTSVPFAADIIRHFITNPYEAMTVVDRGGIIRYISPVHERFFKLRHGSAVGLPVHDVIENTRLDVVLRTGRAEIGQAQEMQGTTRVVSRTPIFGASGEVIGAIGQVMFKSPDALTAMSAEITRLRQEVSFYKREFKAAHLHSRGLSELIGSSELMQRLKEQILKVAALDVPVLLTGESGVGKDLVAHAIHLLSARAREPMVVINAAALPADLVESELFGYESGAFTGADRKGRRGKFEQADGGTLFLDEIGDMPIEIQAKLLRTLQDGSFHRIGGDASQKSDFRLIAASNRDFRGMIDSGRFRLDLFYRISAVTLRVPPLRERLEDIALLVEAELSQFAARHRTAAKYVTPDVIRYLQSLTWPGNVRQLQHVVARAAIFAEGDTLQVRDFEPDAQDPSWTGAEPGVGAFAWAASPVRSDKGTQSPPVTAGGDTAGPTDPRDIHEARDSVESDLIRAAMRRLGGNKKRAAEQLGISRSYLYKKLARMESEAARSPLKREPQ